MARLTMPIAVAMAASIMASSLSDYQKMSEMNKINYYGRGKGGRKNPRTFSGVARARRAAKKAANCK